MSGRPRLARRASGLTPPSGGSRRCEGHDCASRGPSAGGEIDGSGAAESCLGLLVSRIGGSSPPRAVFWPTRAVLRFLRPRIHTWRTRRASQPMTALPPAGTAPDPTSSKTPPEDAPSRDQVRGEYGCAEGAGTSFGALSDVGWVKRPSIRSQRWVALVCAAAHPRLTQPTRAETWPRGHARGLFACPALRRQCAGSLPGGPSHSPTSRGSVLRTTVATLDPRFKWGCGGSGQSPTVPRMPNEVVESPSLSPQQRTVKTSDDWANRSSEAGRVQPCPPFIADRTDHSIAYTFGHCRRCRVHFVEMQAAASSLKRHTFLMPQAEY